MMQSQNWKKPFLLGALVLGGSLLFAGCGSNQQPAQAPQQPAEQKQEIAFNPPKLEELKDDEMGKSIKRGYELMNKTYELLPDNVGNKLACSSCHTNAGTEKMMGFVGTAAQFPQYRAREGIVFTLSDRINGCMKRSMNGKPLPIESQALNDMTNYITWLSKGIPVGIEKLPWGKLEDIKSAMNGDAKKGEELFTAKGCVACHGADGKGTGATTGPALWGPDSFNNGAGLGRVMKLAAYLKAQMPKGQPNTLSEEEAGHLAKFILSKDRPQYKYGNVDWPKGGKPADVPYPVDSDKKQQ